MKKYLLLYSLFICSHLSAQQTVGLFLNDPQALNGYTLFTRGEMTYLLDNCGFVVHSWESNYITNTSAYLLENGDLLRTCRVPGNPFNGGGIAGRIERHNWEGELLWAYNYANEDHHHHHDIEPMPNGNLLILAWDRYTQEEAEARGRFPGTVDGFGLWPEKIVEVEMVGSEDINVVWEWKLWDHLIQDIDATKENFGTVEEHPELVDINANVVGMGPSPGESADWVHANAVAYNSDLDQIAISSRSFSEIWVIDHSTTTEEATGHTGGDRGKGGDLLYRYGNPQIYKIGDNSNQVFYGQHNVTWLPDGHPHAGKMMVFNNGQNRFPDDDDYSSVDIWEPPVDGDGNYILDSGEAFGPEGLTWSFDTPGFYSANISGAQGLPNGNILACEGRDGRFLEITESGEIVWEYISPITAIGPVEQGGNITNNSVFRATRYSTDYLAFEGRDLTPGPPLELNPWPSDCEIFDGTSVATFEEKLRRSIWLRQNPVSQFLHLENASGLRVKIQVFDATGRPVFATEFQETTLTVETGSWSSGIYVMRVMDENGHEAFSEKILKL